MYVDKRERYTSTAGLLLLRFFRRDDGTDNERDIKSIDPFSKESAHCHITIAGDLHFENIAVSLRDIGL